MKYSYLLIAIDAEGILTLGLRMLADVLAIRVLGDHILLVVHFLNLINDNWWVECI